MAGQNSHAILDLGEDELQFSTHDYKSTTVSHMDYCGHMQYILYIGSTAIWSSCFPTHDYKSSTVSLGKHCFGAGGPKLYQWPGILLLVSSIFN